MAETTTTTTNREDKLFTIPRRMAVKVDGIFQLGEGVYTKITFPYKAKVILKGLEYIVDNNDFMDLDGYKEIEIEECIIKRNVSTLPKLKTTSNFRGVFFDLRA